MRGWHAAAAAGGLLTLAVLAPVVSGTVWASLAAPGIPRDAIAPALVVPFDRPDAVTSQGAAPVAPPLGAGPTTSPGHGADDTSSGPQKVRPDRVREVDDSESEPAETASTGTGTGASTAEERLSHPERETGSAGPGSGADGD